MMNEVRLGEVTCPSGQLVLMDGGYLSLWSGSRIPENDDHPGVDLVIVGRDAAAAAASFDRQSGLTLYDIPTPDLAEFSAVFGEHCRERGLDASLEAFPAQVPHRERVRRAIASGDPDFMISGVPVVPVGGLPPDRPLPVIAVRGPEWGWTHLRVVIGDGSVVRTRALGSIWVDWARFVIADADALDAWQHEASIDGLADVVFWGGDQEAVAARFGAGRGGPPGDDVYGWRDLPVPEAYDRAVALQEWRDGEAGHRFAFDFRPHSHHWRVMAGVRASEHESATIEVGGASIMFAMTSVGDGSFPVHLELDAAGSVAGIRIVVTAADR